MKRIYTFLCLFLFVSGVVHAEEPIVGAFGMTLGEVWNGEAAETLERDGYLQHFFIPESPLDAFDNYYVDVTPVKDFIFRIEAWKIGGDYGTQCLAFRQALIKKYGFPEWLSMVSYEWTQGNRSINLYCYEELRLTYFDLAIYESRLDELEPDSSNL
jgi:hypothetical protein